MTMDANFSTRLFSLSYDVWFFVRDSRLFVFTN